jgi:soluble lytic murein transglycosylase
MLFRDILSLFPIALATLVLALPAQAQTPARGDDVVLEMNQAFKKGDRKRLTALLPGTRGHLLEPWAAYWELRARLDDASTTEVQSFLTRFEGSYQEDRLRNDWLLLLGQRREWTQFAIEHPLYRMGDDREVRCYALLVDFQRNPAMDTTALADEVRRNWHGQKEADEGCALAAERLIDARKLSAANAWRKARLSVEANRPRAARRAVEIISPDVAAQLADLLANPAKFLASRSAISKVRKELVVLALVKMAANDIDAAETSLKKWAPQLSSEERNWVWGALGRQSAGRLLPDTLARYDQVTSDADLSDEMLAWKVRANLRETGGVDAQARWKQVHGSINAMSDEARRDPAWVYWKARAMMALNPTSTEATSLLEGIASPRGFYEQLALEQLGRQITVPAAPAPLTAAEREAVRLNPTLNRALYAIGIGLRSEGVREWNYGTNLVNGQGLRGASSDRELLAAADLACEREVWDRCINTSERTRADFDATQRFPMPFREAVVKRSKEIGLDAAYVYGLIRQESRFIMDARSGVGASGLMQVMPATARWTAKKIGLEGFTADKITDRDTNIAIGTGYLKLVLDDFAGSMPLAAAAYNAGPSRPRAWRNGPVMDAAIWAENVPFAETRDYVKKVLANTTVYAAVLSGQPQSLRARLGRVGPRDATVAEVNKDLP